MKTLQLITERLELVAGTVKLARAELNDLTEFAELLGVPKPKIWPPPLNDENSQRYFLASLEQAGPEDAGWHLWFCVRREPRELVGGAGFKGGPRDGVVEIGYSMLESEQRQGYGTEAVRALIGWAFRHPGVKMVIGHTLPELRPSIRVMEKCGFAFAGEGAVEDGMETVRYELTRPVFEQSQKGHTSPVDSAS
jgi:[ribosomal protein S5]-alanine N-acetyltransferase